MGYGGQRIVIRVMHFAQDGTTSCLSVSLNKGFNVVCKLFFAPSIKETGTLKVEMKGGSKMKLNV